LHVTTFSTQAGDYPTDGGKILIDDRELFIHLGWSWHADAEAPERGEWRPALIGLTLSRYSRDLAPRDAEPEAAKVAEIAALRQQLIEHARAALEVIAAQATRALCCGVATLDEILEDWRGRRVDAPGLCPQLGTPRRPVKVSSSLDAAARYLQANYPRWKAARGGRP
jgi:hypothetical protein